LTRCGPTHGAIPPERTLRQHIFRLRATVPVIDDHPESLLREGQRRRRADPARWAFAPEFNTSVVDTWVPLIVRVPDVALEQVAGREAAPRVRAVPVGRAAAARAPGQAARAGRAPAGPGPQEQEPETRELERAAPVVQVRSAAAVALAVSALLGVLAVPMPAPEGRDWLGQAPSPRGEEPPQGWVGSPVSVQLAAPRQGPASRPSAGSQSAPTKDWGQFAAHCWPVWAPAFPGGGRPWAVCRRAPVKAWVR